ncbi:amidohydrolase family protein [Alkalilacustris brevis]|uniref:amidohydrolase family protein n=1 Tax=Alkalilacustris brevis TaxID=2026338 RepID=UPI000E0DCCD4|nr:amidohydrolase family protein [Alkalilacustris brevis]
MIIDAYTHFIPAEFIQAMEKIAGDHKDIGMRMRSIPAVHDLDVRKRVVAGFPDYRQVIAYPQPPIENIAKPEQIDDLLKLINDGLAGLCEREPDTFCGWIAQASLASPDCSAREVERAIANGALGVQVYTNVNGEPLDQSKYEPFFDTMNRLGKPVWLHPARTAAHPDYMSEDKSLYEIWWALGWSYETAAAFSRLVFSQTFDRYEDLQLVLHHFGGIIPMLEGRIGPGWDQLGSRTSGEDYGALLDRLKKRPLDYFKQNCFVDCATFGGRGAMLCGLDFFAHDKILFASDCPFDPEQGPGYIRDTIAILDALDLSESEREAIYSKNIERLTGRDFGR